MLKKSWWVLRSETDGAGSDAGGGAGDSGSADSSGAGDAGAASGGVSSGADSSAASAGAGSKGNGAAVEVNSEQHWRDDWRKLIAGEDEKELKQLGRYASPVDIWKKARALEARMSSGELKAVLPKDAKPEEIAQWRKDNGIPEAPDKYELKLADNVVIGDADKPAIDDFMKSAHAKNMTPDQVSEAVNWYYRNQASLAEQRAQRDEEERQSALDTLNQEWGGNFRQNVNMVGGLLSHFPESAREALKNARMPDGRGIFNDPDVLRGFAAIALEINPAATSVPSGQGDAAKGIDDRIAEIEKMMTTDRKAYNKDSKVQQEYRDLLTAREKIQQRRAA